MQENATSPENVGNQLIASVLIRIGSMCSTKSPHNTKINCYKLVWHTRDFISGLQKILDQLYDS